MSERLSHVIESFNELVHEAQVLMFITRGSDLQRNAVTRLSDMLLILGKWKQEAIRQRNEDCANFILGMECLAKALQNELTMWLSLKEENAERAWENLIAAETEISHAMRAHEQFVNLEEHAQRLDAVEKLVFPPQVFLSAGLIVRKQICSICESDYEDCPHLVGMPYWGQFCFRRLMEVEPNHVAMVTDPANKLCRITHFNVEGGRRNRMTWRVEARKRTDQNVDDQKGLQTDAILLTVNDLGLSGLPSSPEPSSE
jgi:hypothetical protein